MTAPSQIKSYPDTTFRQKLDFSGTANFAEARKLARELCSTAFENLDEFPHLYFTAGVTEAIDFLCSKRRMMARPTEYRYVFGHPTVTTQQADITFASYPFSGTGKFEDIPENKEVILDCSYIFASNMSGVKRLPSHVSTVAFGLSKSHNLADVRCGWFFSKKVYATYHVLQTDYDYGSSIHLPVLRSALEYRPNELYLKFKDKFSSLYEKHQIEEVDTNLFGLTGEVRRPWYTLDDGAII